MTKRIEIPLDPSLWMEYYRDPKVQSITKKQIKYTMDLTGVDYDTLKAEADYYFVVACYRYREFSRKNKGKAFSSWYWMILHDGLSMFRTRNQLKHDNPANRVYGTNIPDDEREFVDTLPDKTFIREFKMVDFYLSLTPDEKYLVDFVLTNHDLVSRRHLYQLVVQRGKWDEERYWKAYNHIREMLYD